MRQWNPGLQVPARKWTDPERFFRWLGSRGTGSRFARRKIVCLHSGRLPLRRFVEKRLMEDLVMWHVTCLECSVQRWWQRSEISELGMDGRPFSLCPALESEFELVVIFLFGWKDLVQQGAFRDDRQLLGDK